MTRLAGKRKSAFSATTELQTTDFLDLVRSSQNLKIEVSDFITGLGVSGPLQSIGESTGTPVLSVSGGVNYIRNIVDGAGITSTVTVEGGLELVHNFTVNRDYEALIVDETIASPVIRSLKAGTGAAVAASGNYIEISLASSPATNTVVVYTLADLPTPVAGIITLLDNTEYFFANSVDIGTNRFIMGDNTTVYGNGSLGNSITYTGTGILFTAIDKTIGIFDIKLTAATGTLFAFSDSTGTKSLTLRQLNFTACLSIGSVSGFLGFTFTRNQSPSAADGLTLSGYIKAAYFDTGFFVGLTGSNDFLDIQGATFDFFVLKNIFLTQSSTGVILRGDTSSANITANGLGIISKVWNTGTSSLLAGISPYDVRWNVKDSIGSADSAASALATNSGETITIASAATPVLMGVSAWTNQDIKRFTGTATGVYTYVGRDTFMEVTASITADIATGTDDCTFFVALNGIPITDSGVTRQIIAGDPGNLSVIWSMDVATNDTISIMCQNDDTDVDITVGNATIRIKE